MKNLSLKILDEVVVRSPAYPFQRGTSKSDIYKIIEDPFFLEAIFIASPVLYNEVIKFKIGGIESKKEKEKIISTLIRYYYRMFTRSTPFGLFSTCGVLKWGSSNIQPNPETFFRHTRLDVSFLQDFVDELAKIPEIGENILYHTNNSVYVVGDEIRYIENVRKNGNRKGTLSAVSKNDIIMKVLELGKQEISKKEIISQLTDFPIETSAILVQDMIDSQLLLSEFELSPSHDKDFGEQIIKTLNSVVNRSKSNRVKNIAEIFQKAVFETNQLDKKHVNSIVEYKKIIDILRPTVQKIDESKIFHVDSYRSYDKRSFIRESAKSELQELVLLLVKINAGRNIDNSKMELFKQKFIDRYDQQILPLVEVLDEDIGIGYPVDRRTDHSPMVDNIPFFSKEESRTLNFSRVDEWLSVILKDVHRKGLYSVQLEEYPPLKMNESLSNFDNLPPSFSAMFRLMNNEEETMIFDTFISPSAASILARFTYGNMQINNLVKTIIEQEEENTENAVFAEIVHIPDNNRVLNVIAHPTYRNYEIPYLAAPAKKDRAIEISDLFIYLENNEIVLFSKKLGKRIIPTKTQMHNHAFKALPLYHFLVDLQIETSNRKFNFTWGTAASAFYNFFPRVYFKKTIVTPAMWLLTEANMKFLNSKKDDVLINFIKSIKEEHKLPRLLLYIEGDNELLLDFENEESVKMWIQLIKNKQSVLLKEFLLDTDSREVGYINQYVASIINLQHKKYPKVSVQKASSFHQKINRQLPIGSDWLYIKLYCGSGSADQTILKTIFPIIKSLQEQKKIEKWFFIKYIDSDYHLRLRIQLNDIKFIGTALNMINLQVSKNKAIWKSLPDNYIREIERYGINTIEICESIFCIDSEVAVSLIYTLQNRKESAMIFWWGMRLINDFLDSFNLSINEKILFVDFLRKEFQKEFVTNKFGKEIINSKYNIEIITDIMSENEKNKDILEILNNKLERQEPFIRKILDIKSENALSVDFGNLISSLIHMMLNRLITNKERINEFLLYEYLYKYYQMLLHKGKASF